MFASNTSQVSEDANYIESCFSTYLYTGNGSTQTITNGIDLSGKGGMVWIKNRGLSSTNHRLFDTNRGIYKSLSSNLTNAENTATSSLTAYNSTGFSLAGFNAEINDTGNNYASWTFREQPKFFDVVTYTGNGTSGRSISHSLGSVPGCIIIKSTTRVSDWVVYHQSVGSTKTLILNSTVASADYGNNISSVTSTSFNVTGGSDSNANGDSYVAYLFAHDAGGFGLTGTDNVISCGSFTSTSGGSASVTLGYEPQWLLIKRSSGTDNWYLIDNMRGYSYSQTASLAPNSSAAEDTAAFIANPTATGFEFGTGTLFNSSTYIYIAIRRGPMKVPTTGTSVFAPVTYTGNGSTNTVTSNFPVDLSITKYKSSNGPKITVIDRLRGFGTATDATKYLFTSATDAEGVASNGVTDMGNTGLTLGAWSQTNFSSADYIDWMFQRAPSFFDEVCYTGTASVTTVAHNLGAVPELIIVKIRDAGAGWYVYNKDLTSAGYYLLINSTAAQAFSNGLWNSTQPTSSSFTVGTGSGTNGNGSTYVAYLFATCAGVSKVGSYTGTGTTLQIDCGFTGGARFVLIKRTDSTGDWYVWDTARGIVSGNDPYLLLNSTAAETTGTDYIDTYSAGFEISSTAPAAINASGGTFIFLAIA